MEGRFGIRWYVYGICAALQAHAYAGRWDLALGEGKEALRIAEEYQDDSLITFAMMYMIIVYVLKGDLDCAIALGKKAVQKAPTAADRMWSQSFLSLALCRAGDTEKGIEILTGILPVFRSGRFRLSEIPALVFLGEGYWRAGEYDKAKDTLKEASELAERCDYKFHGAWVQRIMGEIALETGAIQASSHFERSMAVFREIKAENELALAYAGYGKFHKQNGNVSQAREYLEKALEIFERLGTLLEPDKVRKELAEWSV